MTGRILAALSLVLGLAACDSGINLNPFTWFGGSTDEKLVAVEPSGGWPTGEDPRELVAQITALSVDRTTAGAIVHATGLPPKIGYWEAELVAENDGKPVDGVVTYRFHVWSPLWEQGTGSEYARSIDGAALNAANFRL
ncbi:MAG: hypothetical protein P8X43_10760 [Maritimibacter sp.]